MRSDDLSTLFGGKGDPSPFRQGVVVAWEPATYENIINVGGTDMQNLPVFDIGDPITLAADDVVVLVKLGTSWAVLGRFITPPIM